MSSIEPQYNIVNIRALACTLVDIVVAKFFHVLEIPKICHEQFHKFVLFM